MLPSALDLYTYVCRVMSPGVAERIADSKVHGLDRKRRSTVYGPVESKLAIASCIRARSARGVRDSYIRLDVDSIGSVLAPLSGRGEHDLER